MTIVSACTVPSGEQRIAPCHPPLAGATWNTRLPETELEAPTSRGRVNSAFQAREVVAGFQFVVAAFSKKQHGNSSSSPHLPTRPSRPAVSALYSTHSLCDDRHEMMAPVPVMLGETSEQVTHLV